MCVEPEMRAAAAVAWEAAAQISLHVLALSSLDNVAAACIVAALLLRALQQHEEVVVHRKPSDRVVDGAELCE